MDSTKLPSKGVVDSLILNPLDRSTLVAGDFKKKELGVEYRNNIVNFLTLVIFWVCRIPCRRVAI